VLTKKDVILALFYSAHQNGRYLTKTAVHKIITILMRESRLGKIAPFRIKPYHYGPYSPDVEEVLRELESEGLVKVEELGEKGYAYSLTDEGLKRGKEAYEKLFRYWGGGKIAAIMDSWSKAPLRALLYYVYLKYPDLTVRSRIKDKVLGRVDAK